MEHFLDFKPLIRSPYCQTLFGTTFNLERGLPSKTHYISFKDNDVVTIEISTPKDWKEDGWTVLLIHGLCGSHKSHYMNRIARKLYKKGHQSVRINMRGSGSGKGLARGIYHGGSSGDVMEVIDYIEKQFPHTMKALVGFSLGGNIALKLVGELGKEGPKHLKGVIAVGAPVDLLASARLFMQPQNQLYAKYFLRSMMANVNFRHEYFNDLPPHNLPSDISLHDFDELYVAPRANYTSALEYYYQCSAKRTIGDICIPSRVLFAEDDPIISSKALSDIELPKGMEVYKTAHGGHIGFVGQNIFKDFRWMDKKVVNWIEEWTPEEMKKDLIKGELDSSSESSQS